jgi:hypothetical protein
VTELVLAVIAFAAGWSSARCTWRAAGDWDGPRPVPVPGLVVVPAPTHPAVPRPAFYDWAVEYPELAGPTELGGSVSPGRLGRRRSR